MFIIVLYMSGLDIQLPDFLSGIQVTIQLTDHSAIGHINHLNAGRVR